jgi:hypothetical protein
MREAKSNRVEWEEVVAHTSEQSNNRQMLGVYLAARSQVRPGSTLSKWSRNFLDM